MTTHRTATPETQQLRTLNAARLRLRAIERYRVPWLECAFWTLVNAVRFAWVKYDGWRFELPPGAVDRRW